MGNQEQASSAAGALSSDDRAARRAAAETLRDLAKQRTSLLALREPLVAALSHPDEAVQAAVAVALLIDAWRFSGLLPVVTDLEQRLAGPHRTDALAAAIEAAGRLNDFAHGTRLLVELLARELPGSAALLSRVAGQGADLTTVLNATTAALADEVPAAGDPVAGLWLAALARAESTMVVPHLARLTRWLTAERDDWRFDDLRYRATEQVIRARLAAQDHAAVRALAGSALPAVREATVDSLATAWAAGRDIALAAELLTAHVNDSAGGVSYSAIRGMARAAAAGVDLPIDATALLAALPSAHYSTTGWTYPLDATGVSDLRSESAAADLATVLATRARQMRDSTLDATLRAFDAPEIVQAVRAVLDNQSN